MFGRNKDDKATAAQEQDPQHREGAKNRPTPRRKDQEAARKRPLVQDDRKAAKAADREARRAEGRKVRQAMATGDDRHLPPRDKGPVRRYVRDTVDARWSLGELLLPLMIAVLVLSLFAGSWATFVFLAVYLLIIVAIIDAWLLWRRTKPKVIARFGEDTQLRGVGMYQAMRAFQMRRTRLPKPKVDRGAKV